MWTQPISDGGSPITGYVIEKQHTTTSWTAAHTDTVKETEYTLCDLSEGKEYKFRVAAVNKAGQGSFSEPTCPTAIKSPPGKLFLIFHLFNITVTLLL